MPGQTYTVRLPTGQTFSGGGAPPLGISGSGVPGVYAPPGAGAAPMGLPGGAPGMAAPLGNRASSVSSGLGQSSSSSTPGIIPGMQGVYNQLLGLNQQNYQRVLDVYKQHGNYLNQQLPSLYQGYGGLQQQVQGQYANLGQGYGALSQEVMNTLGLGAALGQNGNWGVAGPAATAIRQLYAQQRGATDQQLINSGLGNTTVRGNFQNQNALQAAQAYGNLGAQLAQTAAGYQAQFGLSGLAAQQQGIGLGAQIGQAGLGARQAGLGMQTGFTGNLMNQLAGYRFANTAGGLTGQTSTSQGTNMSTGASYGAPLLDAYGRPIGTGRGVYGGPPGGGGGTAGRGFSGGYPPTQQAPPNYGALYGGSAGGGYQSPGGLQGGTPWNFGNVGATSPGGGGGGGSSGGDFGTEPPLDWTYGSAPWEEDTGTSGGDFGFYGD